MSLRRAGMFLVAAALTVSLLGCSPTYPKERLKEAIIKLCKNEYKVDVKVRTVGKTVAIYIPIEDLMDFAFAMTPEATEKLNNVILSVTRVVLSTDAQYEFYCVIAHDVRIPEIQVIIIKSVMDVKRVFLGDISRGEFGKRMIVDMRLNPQSQKERSIKEIFQKMDLDPRWQDQVMNDFFRSEPTSLGDIGYWNGRFYVKDITLPEFIAEQVVSRVKMEFREDKKLLESASLKSVKGAYYENAAAPYFKFEFLAEPKSGSSLEPGLSSDDMLRAIVKIASDVVHGYAFEGFDHIEVVSAQDGKKINIAKDALEKFRTGKIKFEEMVK